jgi:thiamine biosynthesis lipoprotein
VKGLIQQYGGIKTRIFLVSVLMTFASHFSQAQIDIQQDTKLETSTSQLKLLIFSGSDWCLPCIRFERTVLQDTTFLAFSEEYLVIEKADFPQHKKLTKEQVRHNEALAEKYNPQGYFPHILLINEKGKVLKQIITNKVDAENVISQIQPYLPVIEKEEFSASLLLMGSSFQITLVAEKSQGATNLAEAINKIQEIESWLSSWQEGSITSKLNNEAGKNPVQVPDEYFQLVGRCLELSKLTQGAFDISFNGLGNLYEFDQQEHDLPANQAISNRLMHVGYEKIVLHDNQRISFSDSLVRIGFGAIGKGYAAEQVKKLMIAKGLPGGVVNASGDLTTWGTRANGEPWKVGVPEPDNKDNIILWLPVEEKAIATSGDYEKYFTNNGQRYSHIINPKSGLPVVGANSVSIISDNAELSDALATAVSVLGLDVGMNLINQIDGVECVFIDNNRKLHFSTGLDAYAY